MAKAKIPHPKQERASASKRKEIVSTFQKLIGGKLSVSRFEVRKEKHWTRKNRKSGIKITGRKLEKWSLVNDNELNRSF